MGHPTAAAIVHKDEIIQRMALGEPLTSIARSLGYSDHTGIINRLDQDPDYKAALRAGLVGKIEKREAELEIADTNVTVTRADRLLGHARWWAERLDPARFGVKQDQGQVAIQVVIQTYDKKEEKVIVSDNQQT